MSRNTIPANSASALRNSDSYASGADNCDTCLRPRVCLYIPTRNSAHTLGRVLESLAHHSHLIDELMVIDGDSEDSTCRIARLWGAQVIPNSKRHVAAARKLAVEMTSADILISLDSDCIPSPGWLPSLLAHFSDPDLAGVGGPYTRPLHCSGVEAFSAQVFEQIMAFPTSPTYVSTIQMGGTFVEGNCAFCRKDVLDAGNYRECFTNHAEGVDLFWRMIRKGCKLLFDPGLTVEHLGYPRTLSAMMRRSYHYGWSSTKLAKYTLRRPRVDLAMMHMIMSKLFLPLSRFGDERKAATLSLCQLLSFQCGKILSSLALRYPNL